MKTEAEVHGAKSRGFVEDSSASASRGGFTLVEVLFVVIILGLIAALVVGNLGKRFTTGQVKTTQAQLRLLANAVESFKADVGRYPTEQEGLQALVVRPQNVDASKWDKAGYIERRTVPKDAWNNPYVYKEDATFGFLIRSFGADGKEGGEGADMDLDNRQ
jgi:general secretion pathway protein G